MASQTPLPEGDDDYSMLKDVRIRLDRDDGAFSICMWIYLLSSTRSPATIVRQMHSDIEGTIPLLALNEEKKLTLFPLLFLHKEAPHPRISASWANVPSASAEAECPLGKWVHVGCEVAKNFVRLHVDGVMVGELLLSYSSKEDPDHGSLRKMTLVGNDGGDKRMHGYVHFFHILPLSASVSDHYLKNPPLELSLDSSSFSENHEVEESDGVWSVVGGKASCRRNFSLDVVLLDALGRTVQKEMELVASLVYADNGSIVEKPNNEAEAPLLTSYDGVEFPSTDRPIKLLNGRASFKLKISQLSSKCENRLFRVHFHSPQTERYPFLEACSRPIRCISRNRNMRPSSMLWKKTTTTANQHDGPQSSGADEGFPKVQHRSGNGHSEILAQRDLKYSPPFKRVKVVHEKSSMRIYANGLSEHLDSSCNPQSLTAKDDQNAPRTNSEGRFENLERTESFPSDSESVHARNSAFKTMEVVRNPISDGTIFRYCLEGLYERSVLLREIVDSASDEYIAEFAQQVSLYSGCFHHWQQILMAKRLIQEGNDTWNFISRSQNQVLWEDTTHEIEKRFMTISHCSRGLSDQDIDVLRRVAGCRDYLARENFDKMWHWLYPIAFTLSRGHIKGIWECMSPKWIEGLITKEEAETSLSTPRGPPKPGNFVLRFPTSRSWPHPDAGSLIVTYVGSDYTLHHRLLSLDDSSGVNQEFNQKPLQVLLLAEPELSQLGRVTRSNQIAGEI